METNEPLWAAPDSVRERLNLKGKDTEWTEFLLCGLYCAGAITVSIGISQVEDSPDRAISPAEKNLEIASRDNGDGIVSGQQRDDAKIGTPGLSSYFNKLD